MTACRSCAAGHRSPIRCRRRAAAGPVQSARGSLGGGFGRTENNQMLGIKEGDRMDCDEVEDTDRTRRTRVLRQVFQGSIVILRIVGNGGGWVWRHLMIERPKCIKRMTMT